MFTRVVGEASAGFVRTALDEKVSASSPEISVVLPVFNQAAYISEVIEGLVASMTRSFEIIAIDDGSVDQSLEAVLASIRRVMASPLLTRARVLRSDAGLFETACDSKGFDIAEAPLLLEVQADMRVQDKGFDSRMAGALRRYPDLLMVSGRGTENLRPVATDYRRTLGAVCAGSPSFSRYLGSRVLHRSGLRRLTPDTRVEFVPDVSPQRAFDIIFPSESRFRYSGEAGRIAALMDATLPLRPWPLDRMWVGQTVMRGPLMLDRDRYRLIGGLDDKRFFLGFDDHDLAYRAYRDRKLRCGFVPVRFAAFMSHGSTRRRRSIRTEIEIIRHLLRIRSARKSSGIYELGNMQDVALPEPEIRALDAPLRVESQENQDGKTNAG